MSEENITIKITDGVSSSIPDKIERIAASSRKAGTAINNLQTEINKINGTALTTLAQSMDSAASAFSRLTAAQNNAASSMNAFVSSQSRAQNLAAQSAIAQQRLETATLRTSIAKERLTSASNQALSSEQRLAAATAKTSTAQSQAAAAASKAELAALRLKQAQDKLNDSNQRTSSSFTDFAKRVLSITAIALATKKVIEFADSYVNLQNKLQTISDSQGQVNILTDKMYELATKTRSSVDDTAQSYVRFDRALKQMGKSQEDTLRMTETINKALIISGANTQEASAALLQLSQAFNSGRLQGDEFRSVSENMPIVLDAVAKALNKPINQVKELSRKGAITSEVLYNAFKLIRDQVDATFAKTTPTVAQALENLTTKSKQFFGELGKNTGLTKALAASIILLSTHLKEAAVASVALGSAMLVAFGPALLSVLSRATAATLSFTASLMTNPIGLLLVAISSAIAALVMFGDQINVTSDGVVNLQDVFKAALSYIGDYFETLLSYGKALWDMLTSSASSGGTAFTNAVKSIMDAVIFVFKANINTTIAYWVAAYEGIKAVWTNFPAVMSSMWGLVINAASFAAETVLNSWQSVFRNLALIIGTVKGEWAQSINDALDKMKISLPRVQVDKEGADAGKAMADAMAGAFNRDYLSEIGTALTDRARQIKELNKAEEDGAKLRGAGANTLKSLDDEKKKRVALTQEQKDYNKALKELTAPQREYNAALAVARDLYNNDYISLDRYNSLVEKATDAYKKATDPIYEFTKSYEEQLRVLSQVGPAMEAERNIIQAHNAAVQAGLPFTSEMAQKIKDMTLALNDAQIKHDALNTVYDATIGKQKQIIAQQQAYTTALQNGVIGADAYSVSMQKLAVDAANLRLQMGTGGFNDAIIAGMGQVVSGYQGVMSGLSNAWGNFFTSFVDGFSSSIGKAIVYGEDLQTTLSNVSKQILSEFIGALIKVGIQYVVNQALASTAIATTTAQSTAAAATTTAAWAPAAAVANAGSFGGAAVAGIAALAMIFGMVLAFASKGFESGGYTGDYGTSDIAGVVHGKEFVVNASATRKHRATLEAMNAGADQVNANSGDNGGGSGNSVVMVAFDITNNISVEGNGNDSSATSLEKAASTISKKTQADIMDSIRMGGTWSTLIRNTR